MTGRSNGGSRGQGSSTPGRRARPQVEDLESRLLLYSTIGGGWSYGNRITFSFVPDGTSVSGTPSTLYQSLTAIFPNQNVWQNEFLKAAAVWQQVANINLVYAPYDSGAPIGSYGQQQGDPNFGDIRISAIPLTNGTLGAAYSPPPMNGGTVAGDIIMNSTTAWRIGSSFDLETVAIHEFGHALGMNHSQISSAVMYAYYGGVNQTLTTDDVSGISSIYGARQYDAFNYGTNSNGDYYRPTPLDWFLDANNQVTFPYPLNLTTVGQTEFFSVTAPGSTSGSLTVVAQAKGFSMLSPRLWVYDVTAGYSLVGTAGAPNFGSVAWLPNLPAVAGHTYLFQISGYVSNNSGSYIGAFGLQVNLGSAKLPTMTGPSVSVASKADAGGGISAMQTLSSSHELLQVGDLVGVGDALTLPGYGSDGEPSPKTAPVPISRPAAPARYMRDDVPDFSPQAAPSTAVFFVSAARGAKKAAYAQIRGVDRAASAWAHQASPSKILSGKMRSRGGSKT